MHPGIFTHPRLWPCAVALVVLLIALTATPTGAVCYPEYENCGDEFMEWLALNYEPPDGGTLLSNTIICNVKLKDILLRPAKGVHIALNVLGNAAQDGVTAETDENGEARLSITKDVDWGMHYASCEAFPNSDTIFTFESVGSASSSTQLTDMFTVLTLGFAPDDVPELNYALPDDTAFFQGLKSGNAEAQLFLAGEYDNPIIFVPPFDSGEGGPNERTIEVLFRGALGLLSLFQDNGIDVWIFKPRKTTQNLHEQAAELAQAIEYAATFNGGPPDGKVTVLGHSTGGLVSRIATARWEDPQELSWRQDVELLDPLLNEPPVNLLVMLDTPNRGVHLNVAMQGTTWAEDLEGAFNLNSCAATQMLHQSCKDWTYNGFWYVRCESGWSQLFYEGNGEDLAWDFNTSDGNPATVICEGGPGLDKINGDGYPHTPRVVAVSQGQVDSFNVCYGDKNDPNSLDLNFEGKNVCRDRSNAGALIVGENLLKIVANWHPDFQFKVEPWDTMPGSRSDTLFDIGEGTVQRYGGATFVPLVSAFDVRDCGVFDEADPRTDLDCLSTVYDANQGGYQQRHPAIDYARANEFVGTHANFSQSNIGFIFNEVLTAFGVDPGSPDPRPGTDGSCELRCDDSEPSGSCYCDIGCEIRDDCCGDYAVSQPPAGAFAGCRPAPVCGDTFCEPFSGWETANNCCADCGTCGPSGPVCGDALCESGESSSNCPADCGQPGGSCKKNCVGEQ